MVTELNPSEFLERRAAGAPMTLLDVREQWELGVAPAPTPVVHIPLGQLAERLRELNPQTETVVLCRSGGRSLQAANFLASSGFASVSNLSGGILAWSRDVDPSIAQY